MSPEFSKKLRRSQRLLLHEIKDGCVECMTVSGYCDEHHDEVMRLILHPLQHKGIQDLLGINPEVIDGK